ncbi:uncharacterized protein LOC111333784 isoform X2 [Stylophora pistillata]|uniref:uncharacterized protein LOC111333784 isoform X2 n=1 Tax=Stylophora pistillata TaxID=50429 RepID=UPI000C03EB41|nr:uncharacterized protein LOC111333784 isoform X2 [Stylophora pistillata]
MADGNAWEPLVENLTKSFSNLSPQILPGMHDAKKVLQALQSGLNDSRQSRAESQIHCKWCGRIVSSDHVTLETQQESVSTVQRVLTWNIDWTKRILRIKGAEVCCQDCQLLLNLARLLNFLLSSDNSSDITKLYSLASHFSQLNGHTSQSGEDDVMLLQQAVAVVHSLHMLTNSSTTSTSKTKQKRKKAERFSGGPNTTQKIDSSMAELKPTPEKKKKMGVAYEPHVNGYHVNDNEGAVENDHIKDTLKGSAKRKRLILSEKTKKGAAGKVKLGKKRRSLPAIEFD